MLAFHAGETISIPCQNDEVFHAFEGSRMTTSIPEKVKKRRALPYS